MIFNINLSVFMTYFTTTSAGISTLPDDMDDLLLISFEHDLDRITNNRVVYGIMNLLSEVGGFQGMIFMIGGFFVSKWNSK